MAEWNETPNWTPLEQINGGQEFSNMLSPDDLNALAENIEYLYETAQSGTDTSDATAWSAAILEGETAYVDGEKLTGTMPNKGYTEGDFGATLDANSTELELFGAYNGTVTIQPEKITATENGTYKSSAGKVITEVEVAVEGEVIPNYDDESVGFDLTYNGEADGLEIVYSSTLKSALPIATSGHLGFIPEENLRQENIKDGVTILGITGNYGGEEIPEFSEVEGFDVFLDEADEGTITVAYSTPQDVKLPIPSTGSASRLASVDDENFKANNIKKGVSIFGLTGAYEGETVDTWDGTGVVIAPIEEEPTTFTFTIGDTEYEAEEGMTWYEWVRSDYSPDSYSCESTESNVYPTGDTYVADSEGNAVIGSTLITEGGVYSIEEVATEDALAGTWVLNDTLTDVYPFSNEWVYTLNFTSNNNEYTRFANRPTGTPAKVEQLYYGRQMVYQDGDWLAGNAYKTITITTNLSEVTNGEALLTWLQANATKQ